MKKGVNVLTFLFGAATSLIFAAAAFSTAAYAANKTAYVAGSVVNVRSAASTSSSRVARLSANSAVTVTSETTGSDGKVWYAVSFAGKTGYIRSDLLRMESSAASTDGNFEAALSSAGFPDDYKPALRALHEQYPGWTFSAFNTGLDWNEAVSHELEGTSSLVASSSISSWKSTDAGKYDASSGTWIGFDGADWVAASKGIVEYYMDPRNFLDASTIFQFVRHDFDSSAQTLDGVENMVKGTFLDSTVWIEDGSPLAVNSQSMAEIETSESTDTGTETGSPTGTDSFVFYDTNVIEASGGPGMDLSSSASSPSSTVSSSGKTVRYANIIMEAAQKSGVNPYVLASMILQEQGSGTGNSVNGSSGYYNYFNVGAYAANNMSAVERGIWYASQSGSYERPWNSPEKAIVGGAEFFAENYVKQGQNTLYLKKWNVQGSNIYKHQYMTNVQGAVEEGAALSTNYQSLKNSAISFYIPVYMNMPASACTMPTGNDQPSGNSSETRTISSSEGPGAELSQSGSQSGSPDAGSSVSVIEIGVGPQ